MFDVHRWAHLSWRLCRSEDTFVESVLYYLYVASWDLTQSIKSVSQVWSHLTGSHNLWFLKYIYE